MARGRKKGGLNINQLDDEKELIKMIINQANSLNKKIKAFNEKDINDHLEYTKNLLGDNVQFTSTNTISKAKKNYEGQNILQLKKTLSALHKVNNHEYFGTVNKYEKEVNTRIQGIQAYAKDYLKDKGYDEKFIIETVNSKQFITQLIVGFNSKMIIGDSNQVIDKVALSYGDVTGFSEKESNAILNNIEYSNNTANRLKEDRKEFLEWKRNKEKR